MQRTDEKPSPSVGSTHPDAPSSQCRRRHPTTANRIGTNFGNVEVAREAHANTPMFHVVIPASVGTLANASLPKHARRCWICARSGNPRIGGTFSELPRASPRAFGQEDDGDARCSTHSESLRGSVALQRSQSDFRVVCHAREFQRRSYGRISFLGHTRAVDVRLVNDLNDD